MVWSRISGAARAFPLVTSGLIISGQFTVGDVIAQVVVEGKPLGDVDQPRVACFATFGLFAGLGPYHVLYNVLYSTPFFVRAGPLAVALCDCGVMLPTWYFSSFYVFKEVIGSGWAPWSAASTASAASAQLSLSELVPRGLAKWQDDYFDNTKACFTVPFLQNVLMAKYVPAHLKSPFIGITGMVWVTLLSVFRGDMSPASAEEGQGGAVPPVRAEGGGGALEGERPGGRAAAA